MKRLILAILVIGMVLLGACAPTSTSEPPIPAHFTTYTDELGLFSISYPPDWELALSKIEDLEQVTKALLKSIDQDARLDKHGAIFAAGLLKEAGYYSPNVNIIVSSLTVERVGLDEQVEASIQYLRGIAKEYHEFSRVKATVDGKKAVVVEYQANFFGLGTSRHLVMMMIVGKVLWTVTCTALSQVEFNEWGDDFNAIIRSLRILK